MSANAWEDDAAGEPRRIAIACQGGGAQTAFTAGALDQIITRLREQAFDGPQGGRAFDIVALSGASGGALCATLAWFELMLDRDSTEPPTRLSRFWGTPYPNGVASPTVPEALWADWSAFAATGALPWRRFADAVRAEMGDVALHQDIPGPWFPFQVSARIRPYYFQQFFEALDHAPGVYPLRKGLEAMRLATRQVFDGAPPPWRQWGRMIDDAFDLNPFLPKTALREEFDAQDSFRALIQQAFGADIDQMRMLLADQGDAARITPELLISAADVGGPPALADHDLGHAQDGSEALDGFAVFRGSKRIDQMAEALLASAAIPELMRAVEIDGEHYWDGVFSQNPPILDLPDVHGQTIVKRGETAPRRQPRNPQEIWLILINPLNRAEAPRDLAEIDDRKNELAGNISLAQEVRAISKMNNIKAVLKDGDCRHYGEIRFRVIQMTDDTKKELLLPSKLDRRHTHLQRLYAEGQSQAEAFLRRWRTAGSAAVEPAAAE